MTQSSGSMDPRLDNLTKEGMELYAGHAATYEELTRNCLEYVQTLRNLRRLAPGLKDYDSIIDDTLEKVSKAMEEWENTKKFIFENYSKNKWKYLRN